MKEVVLTNEELDIIDRLQNSQFPSAGYDPYEVWLGSRILVSIFILPCLVSRYDNHNLKQ